MSTKTKNRNSPFFNYLLNKSKNKDTNLPDDAGYQLVNFYSQHFIEGNSKLAVVADQIIKQPFFSIETGEKTTFDYYYNWYKKRKQRYRWLFYGAGIIVLIIGFGFSVQQDLRILYENFWLPVSALLISVVGFLGVKTTWQGYYLAMKKMERLHDVLLLNLLRIKLLDKDAGERELIITTAKFVDDLHEVVEAESQSFFSGLRFPKLERKIYKSNE